ncbi:MAG: endonuclease NucS domain-containing protein [Dehalococcoidia bacterium]
MEDNRLAEIAELPADQQGLLEERLEDWLASQPEAIQDNLLIIGRQVSTASGPLDLLGLTVDGKPVVIELKRDRAPRVTVAQAIDYASWIATQTPEEVKAIAARYLERTLDEAFLEKFGQPLSDLQLNAPSILVIASRLDASTERMLQYLSRQYGMSIDGLIFRHVQLPSGEQILIRTSVVSEEVIAGTRTGETYSVPVETLVAQARDRGAISQLNVLRRLSDFLSEDPTRSYGGSFRYWGNGRMLCGVNAVANWGAPQGTIDVWVSHGSWAQTTGLAEETLVEELRSNFEFVKQYDGAHQMILRIKSKEEAERFVELLQRWFGREAEPIEINEPHD